MAKHKLTLFTLTEEYEAGANHIIERIHCIFGRRDYSSLPSTLFIQMENWTRENKIRCLFWYLEILVAWGFN